MDSAVIFIHLNTKMYHLNCIVAYSVSENQYISV